MYTGRQTLGSIENALAQARAQVKEVAERVQHTADALVNLEHGETDQYRLLARLRLNLLAAGELVSGLDDTERRARAILDLRERELSELEAQLQDAEAQHAALEAERDARRHNADEAAAALDKRQAETQQRLKLDSGYQQQLKTARQADRVAKHAEEKTQLAEQDRVEKGKPYEDDPLFRYLWRRGYGSSRYRANPLIRYLDSKVAKLSGFHDARPNYAMLLEIPERLREHAEQQRAVADREFAALQALEREAADADGVPDLQVALDAAHAQLAAGDDKIARHEEQMHTLLARRAQYSAGEDERFKQAVALMAAELRRDGVRTLRRDAELTPLPEDDLVVERLAGLERERDETETRLAEQRQLLDSHQRRLRDLESVRTDFRRRGYDGMHSTFSDGSLVALLLNQFLTGMLSRDRLWREIQRQQRTRTISFPDFGSGGFGRGGTVWRGGGGGFPGRGGFGGGGGFRTGGGF